MWGKSATTQQQQPQQQQQHQSFGGGGGGGRTGGYQGKNYDPNRARGGGGGSFRGGRGRSSGRSGGGRYDSYSGSSNGGGASTMQETPIYDLCSFYVRDGSCKFNENCKRSHAIVTLIALKAHDSAVKTLGVVETPDAPRLLTGSTDATIKVWNIGTDQPEFIIPTKGPVQCIEVSGGSTILYSDDECLEGDPPTMPVAVVRLLNQSNMTTIPILRSEELPYTHSSTVRSFKVVSSDGQTYVVTAGGDSVIRTWRYDPTSSKFELLATMEGHLRAVTCLLLHESMLWSGSTDNSIRVWEVGSGRCVGVLKGPVTVSAAVSTTTTANAAQIGLQQPLSPPTAFGHTDAVSCLELIPATASGSSSGGGGVSSTDGSSGGEAFMASGGGDGEVKLWRTNGEYAHTCSHGAFVTAMKYFQDEHGGPGVLIIGLVDGRVLLRSAVTMELLIAIDGQLHQNQPIWSIVNVGRSCFATAGDSGFFVVCQTQHALVGSGSGGSQL